MSDVAEAISEELEFTDAEIRELQEGRYASMILAQDKVKEAAAAAHRMGGNKTLSFGRQTLRISPASYVYWARRLGRQCWSDPQFLREYARDNPECVVHAKSPKIMSGYRPSNPRFSKTYAF